MTNNSPALQSIAIELDEFRDGVARLGGASFNAGNLKDAYDRLHRLRDRYRHEVRRRSLTPAEFGALKRVFEDDHFIQGLLQGIRTVVAHVEKRPEYDVVPLQGMPFTLSHESSAQAICSSFVPTVTDIDGQSHDIDHLKWLQEAERRITRALQRAIDQE